MQYRLVIAVTGGGTPVLPSLFARPGASELMLEAIVPYHHAALRQFLEGPVEQACSEATALRMAVASRRRAADWLAADESFSTPSGAQNSVRPLGVGVTAALATNRQRRGSDRAQVALHAPDATLCWSIDFGITLLGPDYASIRREQERRIAQLILAALRHWQIDVGPHGNNGDADDNRDTDDNADSIASGQISRREHRANPELARLAAGEIRAISTDGRPITTPPVDRGRLIFPGSFNPLHEGHREMAASAAERFQQPVLFELSITNADKPALDFLTVEHRVDQFLSSRLPYVLTDAPRFDQKAELFPESVFVVGADTITRIGAPRFYGGETASRDVAIERIAASKCRFLVFGRTVDRQFQSPEKLDLPRKLRDLCLFDNKFRNDISSTAIRRQSEIP